MSLFPYEDLENNIFTVLIGTKGLGRSRIRRVCAELGVRETMEFKAFMEERFHIPVEYVDPTGLVKPQPSLAVHFADFQRMAPLLGAVLAR